MAEHPSSSLRRALDLLDALASDDAVRENGWGVNRIAAHLGRDQSQVSRTLRVLADAGYIERDPETLRYRIGWHVFTLAARSADQRLLSAAAPILRRLVEQLGERVHLSVLKGDQVLTLMTEAPSHAVQAVSWAGRMVPAHNTSSGRSLIIDHEPDELARRFAAVDFATGGPQGPTDVADLHARILAARATGYVLIDEEWEPGLVAASAPVRGFRGDVVAALNVSGPKFRLGPRLPAAGQAIKAAADALSAELGLDGRSPSRADTDIPA